MSISLKSQAFDFKGSGSNIGYGPFIYSSTVLFFDRNTIIPDGTIFWYILDGVSNTETGLGIYNSTVDSLKRKSPSGL